MMRRMLRIVCIVSTVLCLSAFAVFVRFTSRPVPREAVERSMGVRPVPSTVISLAPIALCGETKNPFPLKACYVPPFSAEGASVDVTFFVDTPQLQRLEFLGRVGNVGERMKRIVPVNSVSQQFRRKEFTIRLKLDRIFEFRSKAENSNIELTIIAVSAAGVKNEITLPVIMLH